MRKLTTKKLMIIMMIECILAISCLLISEKFAQLKYSNGSIAVFALLSIYAAAFFIVTLGYYIKLCVEKNLQRKARLKNSRIVKYDPNDIYLLLTEITSSYNDGSGFGPQYVKEYFLAYKDGKDFYELFSGTRIEKEEDTHKAGCICKNFDTPYITEVVPMTKCVKKPEEKITSDLLFTFLTDINTRLRISGETQDDFEDEDEVEEN